MATYSKLLLSTGGGIISTGQQAEQTQNTASILIGLGGTGVHCIRTIKTQVYDRLKPDNPNDAVPVYSRIRFLGVDSAKASQKGSLTQDAKETEKNKANKIMDLSESEFFFIGNSHLSKIFRNDPGNARFKALQDRRDLTWLQYEQIDAPKISDAGAGGIRQIGRFMLIDKADEFVSRLQYEITQASMGMTNPSINIHIFSGLSGGTGSGCFLDVCYLAGDIAKSMGGTLFGYFFLPDVNLSPIPYTNTNVRDFIQQNGYASMQELDYCMNLQRNGGAFKQTYKSNHVVSWDNAPVDMCHLICATDEHHVAIKNAYDYAMNVTAEYIMDFLTASTASFDLQQHLSNYQTMIGVADNKKDRGYVMSYCIIGASCASVPLREINTYLASRLFHQFSRVSANVPSQSDVEELAIAALARGAHSLEDIYDALFREVQAGAADSFEAYPNEWKYVKLYGIEDVIRHYADQSATKMGLYAVNATAMMDEKTERSLIARLRNALNEIIADIQKGPTFAYRMISAGEKVNFLNIVQGLIDINEEKLNFAASNIDQKEEEFLTAKADFENRINSPFGNARRFGTFEDFLQAREDFRLEVEVYNHLKKILTKFREQISEWASGYYIRLSRVTETLINTFEENRLALSNADFEKSMSSFSTPMMTISELKRSLDAEIERLDIPNMLRDFMTLLLRNEEEWLSEDESRISKLVTDFFLKVAFQDFANRTITKFLRDKYQEKTKRPIEDGELSEFIYNDWMLPLTKNAHPLFDCDNSIWSRTDTGQLAFLSYPQSSAPIKTAAEKMHLSGWDLKESALTDRIFVMSSACGIPLSAYNKCPEYEQMLFSARTPGRHYYEGKPVDGQDFNNWWELPSIRPQSLLSPEGLPPDLANSLKNSRGLYQQARDAGILNDESKFLAPDEHELERKLQEFNDFEKDISEMEAADEPARIPRLKNMAARIAETDDPALVLTKWYLPQDGRRGRGEENIIDRVREDHFVSSPAFFPRVRRILETIERFHIRRQELVDFANAAVDEIALNEKLRQLEECEKAMQDLEAANAPEQMEELDKLTENVLALEAPALIYLPQNGEISGKERLSSSILAPKVRRIQEKLEHFHTGKRELSERADALKRNLQEMAEKESALRAEEARRKLEETNRLREEAKMFEDFCDALFTGVLAMSGSKITYTTELGREYVLTQVSDNFPYYKIPVYQAYLSFQALDGERRSDIRKEYQKVVEEGGEQLQECGQRMKSELSLTKMKGWNKQAESDTYHEKYDDIYSFLEKFQKSFNTFRELYDIE
ncbi:MAG: hypothetical protein IJQ81_18080 [Oscillibacter sp.]|nr:hypothetical protein [Oscillibacter sp.]